MISKAKCVGVKYGKSRKNNNKPFTTLYFDVTDFVDKGDDTSYGSIYSSLFAWGTYPSTVVGQEIVVSVDDFGNVKDIAD